jgi:hypothetical protein
VYHRIGFTELFLVTDHIDVRVIQDGKKNAVAGKKSLAATDTDNVEKKRRPWDD